MAIMVKSIQKRIVALFLFTFAIGSADHCYAKEPPLPNRAPSSYYGEFVKPKEVDWIYFQFIEHHVSEHKRFRTEDFIPMTLPQNTNDGRMVAGKVLANLD
jgi:hypothetical protein